MHFGECRCTNFTIWCTICLIMYDSLLKSTDLSSIVQIGIFIVHHLHNWLNYISWVTSHSFCLWICLFATASCLGIILCIYQYVTFGVGVNNQLLTAHVAEKMSFRRELKKGKDVGIIETRPAMLAL